MNSPNVSEIEAFVRRALIHDGKRFINKDTACDVTVPSGVSARFDFRGWGHRSGAVFVIESKWPVSHEVKFAKELARIRAAVAAREVPTRDGKPILSINVNVRALEQPEITEDDLAWVKAIIERIAPVCDEWSGGSMRSYAVSPSAVKKYNGGAVAEIGEAP